VMYQLQCQQWCINFSANSDVSTSFLEKSTFFFLGTYGFITVA